MDSDLALKKKKKINTIKHNTVLVYVATLYHVGQDTL